MEEQHSSAGHVPGHQSDWDTATESDDNTQNYASIIPGAAGHATAPAGSPTRSSPNETSDAADHAETKEGKLSSRQETHRNYKLVTFTDNDPANPKNWSKLFKWYCTMVVAVTCFVVAFASSVITADVHSVAKEFNVSNEVALVPIAVFVVGFGVGKLDRIPRTIAAQCPDVCNDRPDDLCASVGAVRKTGYLVSFDPYRNIDNSLLTCVSSGSTLLASVIFVIPCAVANNIATLIVCRIIDGIAFSAPMTLVGGTLADMWRNEERGVPMAAFSAAPFIGPASTPNLFASTEFHSC